MHFLRLKRSLIVPFVFIALLFSKANAQTEDWLKRKVSEARLSFAVPDAPAFKVLDENPSGVMRPSSVQELGLLVTDFSKSGGVLPKTFAAEFAPAMLIEGPSLTIARYQNSPWLYRTRISAAAHRVDNETGSSEAGLGVRFTIKDDSDPRIDQAYLNSLAQLALRINRAMRGVQNAPPTESGVVPGQAVDQVNLLERELESLRSAHKDSVWNASVMEAGIAAKYSSSDSLARHVVIDKYAAWLSATWPIGASGQFLFGANGLLARNAAGKLDSSIVSLSGRFYFGSNALKAFTELQIKAVGDEPAYRLLNLGGELNPSSSFWLEFSLGFEKRGRGEAVIASSFNVRWSLPEELLNW